MKRLLIFSLMLVLGMSLSAQKILMFPADDAVNADTNYIPSEAGYNLYNIQSGVMLFTFTHADVADSLLFAGFEWRNNTDDSWTAYTGNGIVASTSTDGTSTAYLVPPLLHRFVRFRMNCATGDTVTITDQTLLLKTD